MAYTHKLYSRVNKKGVRSTPFRTSTESLGDPLWANTSISQRNFLFLMTQCVHSVPLDRWCNHPEVYFCPRRAPCRCASDHVLLAVLLQESAALACNSCLVHPRPLRRLASVSGRRPFTMGRSRRVGRRRATRPCGRIVRRRIAAGALPRSAMAYPLCGNGRRLGCMYAIGEADVSGKYPTRRP